MQFDGALTTWRMALLMEAQRITIMGRNKHSASHTDMFSQCMLLILACHAVVWLPSAPAHMDNTHNSHE